MSRAQSLKDDELLFYAQNISASERKIYSDIIDALEEIEKRRLYLARGFSSLFSFCTEFLKYSEGAAQRRIASMRLLKSMRSAEKHKVKEKLQSGTINLTHLSKVSQALRSMPKRLASNKKMELLQAIENTTKEQCEKKLMKMGAKSVFKREDLRPINADEHRLSINLDAESHKALQEYIALTAHKNPWASKEMAIHMAIRTALVFEKKKKGKDNHEISKARGGAKPKHSQSSKENDNGKFTAAVAVNPSRYIPAEIKRRVWSRDNGLCQYVDTSTGKVCHSTYALEFDHIHEFAKGGGHNVANLRLLCAAHNRYKDHFSDSRLIQRRKPFGFGEDFSMRLSASAIDLQNCRTA